MVSKSQRPWWADLIACSISVVLSAGLVAIGNTSSSATDIGGIPRFAYLAMISFGINWIAFIPSFCCHTERFYDLVGCITYVCCTASAVYISVVARAEETSFNMLSWRAIVLASCVLLWTIRLGAFLFCRALRYEDRRFDVAKHNFFMFLKFWSIQALWCCTTASAAWCAILNDGIPDVSIERLYPDVGRTIGLYSFIAGVLLWITGFGLEVVADEQKWAFKQNPANKDKFIKHGLWSLSRHPNYVGEVTLWIGVALMSWPALSHRQLALAVISPLFVFSLIRFASGVPLLEASSNKRWGNQPDYELYKRTTPVFWPWGRRQAISDRSPVATRLARKGIHMN